MNLPDDNARSARKPPIQYLTASDLFNINMEITDGVAFVRDAHLLQSAVRRPALALFGEPQFPTLIDKAAALIHSLAYHHLFMDGNKRTAARAVAMFLNLNGHDIHWDDQTQYAFLLEVAQGKYDVSDIATRISGFIHANG